MLAGTVNLFDIKVNNFSCSFLMDPDKKTSIIDVSFFFAVLQPLLK